MTDAADDAAWIGHVTEAHDVAVTAPLEGLAALLNWTHVPEVLPPLGHWLYCLSPTPQRDLGPDGHARLGLNLPDLGLPRRMWAGGRFRFLSSIPVNAALTRRTTVTAISRKTGSTGPLAFVTVRHDITANAALAVVEEQDLVYRPAAAIPLPAPAGPPPAGEAVSFDPVTLFRFSALTFNGHRIHYDLAYAHDVEGYPGLVVHGPYQAMLMMNLFLRTFPDRTIGTFSFRGRAPLFCHERAVLHAADDGTLATYAENGRLCMTANVTP